MNYRHAFHAGNFADVHKHVVLLAILHRLKRKPKAMFYLDTHAGRGRYELQSSDARRGNEWREGIGRVSGVKVTSPDIQQFLDVAQIPADRNVPLQTYHGSPLLALDSLRDIDRAVLVEQQPPEFRVLELAVNRRNTVVLADDGYAALKAFLPPKEARGLVLIDPPYEAEKEFADIEKALISGLDRWATGVFMVWYPLKATAEAARLHTALQRSGKRRLLKLELSVHVADSPIGLNGSGLIIANPPYQLDTDMRAAHKELHSLLAPDGAGGWRVDWLVGE